MMRHDSAPLRVLYLGGTGTISTSCVRLSVEAGLDVHVLNRGNNAAGRDLPGVLRGELIATGRATEAELHVADLADAHLLALESNAPGVHRVLNLGSGEGFSVREVIDVCREVTGHPIPAEVAPRRAGDPAVLIASSEKIQRELGWDPTRTQLRRIVEDAWEFTRELGDRSHAAPKR